MAVNRYHHFAIQLLAANTFAAKLVRSMPLASNLDGFQLAGHGIITGISGFVCCPSWGRENTAQRQEQDTWLILMDMFFHGVAWLGTVYRGYLKVGIKDLWGLNQWLMFWDRGGYCWRHRRIRC